MTPDIVKGYRNNYIIPRSLVARMMTRLEIKMAWQRPLLQSPKCEIVANSHKADPKMPFGPKCKSPKEKEKSAAKRENRLLMCEFGREPSPKDGVAGDD
jgi:hypothetical protein